MRLATLALSLLLAVPAAARADDAARLALAKELMAQIHVSDTMRRLLPVMALRMRATMAQRGMLDRDADTFVKLFGDRASAEMGRYTDQVATAYAGAFTEDELKDLLAFDRTPLGQKLIARSPELAQASMLAGHQLGVDVARQVREEMEGRKGEDAQPHNL